MGNPKRLADIRAMQVQQREGVLYIHIHHTARVHPSSLASLLSDGQGYEWDGREWVKMPQLGGIIIDRDVEIGPNCSLMRGAMSDTFIGRGSRIGNGVNIGHGAQIGAHCLITAGAVIGGSAMLGERACVWMNASIAHKVTIGEGASIAQGASVVDNVPAGEVWGGVPARRIK